MEIVRAHQVQLDSVTDLAIKLWPNHEWQHLRDSIKPLLESTKDRVYVAKIDELYIGFIHLSLRYDYVEGSSSSPVGYIEGIYVEEPYRLKGVSKKLVEAGEAWLASIGCKEIASDTEFTITNSQRFHEKIGFKEAGRIVAFIKELPYN